jgi:hypothetical protein
MDLLYVSRSQALVVALWGTGGYPQNGVHGPEMVRPGPWAFPRVHPHLVPRRAISGYAWGMLLAMVFLFEHTNLEEGSFSDRGISRE